MTETIPTGTVVRLRRYKRDRTRMLELSNDSIVKASGYVSLRGMRVRQSDNVRLYWTSYYVPREYVEIVQDAATTRETPAEELGRLRRELSEHHHDTPEHRMILNRIAVLVREAAEARRNDRKSAAKREP